MKKTAKLLAALAALGISGFVSAGTSIVGSKHDLSSAGGGQQQGTTDQVCVFCHTPHGSDTAAPVPLWNKTLNTTPGATYTLYSTLGTSSLDGEVLNVGSVSLACLSCHDGTQGMDSMLNSPGRGMGAASAGTVGWKMTGTPVPMLGTDLTNDHPIGIEYCGGTSVAGSYTAANCVDDSFNTAIKVGSYWFIDRNSNGSRQKTDIPLYTRNQAVGTDVLGGATAKPYVECASCHDPHMANGTAGAGGVVNFMRVTVTASAICLACHNK